MKKRYDTIFITNLPAFYKLNLYNQIAKRMKILVIFTESTDSERNADFYVGDRYFESISLAGLSTIGQIKELSSLLSGTEYKEFLIGGWDRLIYWFAAFWFPRSKNALLVESSYLESITTGPKGMLKRLFVSRIFKAYVSGKSQMRLVDSLGFKGAYRITKGVGLYNRIEKPTFTTIKKVSNFIYVGRLSPEKNLEFLIRTFAKFPELTLNIVGFGPLEAHLKSIAGTNIIFHGAIGNKKLSSYYQSNDVFILPSLSEPWGLVVEEAYNNGIPVIVSDKVGCADEIVRNGETGLIFQLDDPDSLSSVIEAIQDVTLYNVIRQNVAEMDFEKIENEQVGCYLN